VSIVAGGHDRKEPCRRRLLALQELRRGLERIAAAGPTIRGAPVTPKRIKVIQALRELIEALDRRTPHVERADEASIARESAALKVKALKRITELEAEDKDTTAP
jgi:hypothetical protein